MKRLMALTLAVVLLGGGVRTVRAGSTRPKPILSAATAMVGDGRRTVTLEGDFEFPNVVQVGYPLEIVVFQGTRFVRYEIAGTPVTGTSALLADGQLGVSELAAFLAEGAPAAGDVRIVTLTGTSIRLALPAEFTAGTATAVLFAVLTDDTAISNALALVLP